MSSWTFVQVEPERTWTEFRRFVEPVKTLVRRKFATSLVISRARMGRAGAGSSGFGTASAAAEAADKDTPVSRTTGVESGERKCPWSVRVWVKAKVFRVCLACARNMPFQVTKHWRESRWVEVCFDGFDAVLRPLPKLTKHRYWLVFPKLTRYWEALQFWKCKEMPPPLAAETEDVVFPFSVFLTTISHGTKARTIKPLRSDFTVFSTFVSNLWNTLFFKFWLDRIFFLRMNQWPSCATIRLRKKHCFYTNRRVDAVACLI